LAIGVEVTVILTLVGIRYREGPLRFLGVIMSLSLWVVLAVSFTFVVMARYAATLERTRDMAILRVLGAPSTFVFNILFQETLLLAISGTAIGIAATYGTGWLMMNFASDVAIQETVYGWWPIAGAISVVGALLGSLIPAWKALRHDVIQTLSNEE
jgi:ABC-type antimicrobial peptide transport system permease subunit